MELDLLPLVQLLIPTYWNTYLRSWIIDLQLVKDSGLPSIVQTHNDNFVFCET